MCTHTYPQKRIKKKKGKITKKKKEENGIHESGPLDRVLYSCRCLRKLAEGAKSSPKGTLHAPLTRLDATDIFLNFPIRSFMPRINAYNFRDDYRASDALYTRDPYRSTAREARYPEIETEWAPECLPFAPPPPPPRLLLDLDPHGSTVTFLPSFERRNDIHEFFVTDWSSSTIITGRSG